MVELLYTPYVPLQPPIDDLHRIHVVSIYRVLLLYTLDEVTGIPLLCLSTANPRIKIYHSLGIKAKTNDK